MPIRVYTHPHHRRDLYRHPDPPEALPYGDHPDWPQQMQESCRYLQDDRCPLLVCAITPPLIRAQCMHIRIPVSYLCAIENLNEDVWVWATLGGSRFIRVGRHYCPTVVIGLVHIGAQIRQGLQLFHMAAEASHYHHCSAYFAGTVGMHSQIVDHCLGHADGAVARRKEKERIAVVV